MHNEQTWVKEDTQKNAIYSDINDLFRILRNLYEKIYILSKSPQK